MFCPYCKSDLLKTKNTRPTKSFTQTWRRRECLDCGNIFTTYETLDLSYLKIEKRSMKIQRYNRAKLFTSIYHTTIDTRKADRGEMGVKAELWTKEVENKLVSLKRSVLKSTEVLEVVFEVLQKRSFECFLRYLAYKEQGEPKRIKGYLRRHI